MSEDSRGSGKETSFIEKIVPVLLLATIALAFAVGVMWQKVMDKDSDNQNSNAKVTTTPQAQKPALSMDMVKSLFKQDLVKFGTDDKKVLFVEVSDPSCPYCSIASGKNKSLSTSAAGGKFKYVADGGTYQAPVPEMKKLVDAGKASYIYIYSPGHGAGEMGARAMYCAYEKDKFWEVHDLLMGDKGYDLLNNTIKNDKTKAGEMAQFLAGVVDSSFMKSCLESDKYDKRLASDTQLSAALGAQGTPYFLVNSTPFSGAYDYKNLETVVKSALGE